ncbi:MAG: molybdopterin molybdotransferase MoeA [Gammaproteobacteria bacterium]
MTMRQASQLTPIAAAIEQLLPRLPRIHETELIAIGDAQGRILAEDFLAATAVPPWDNSAMDGFAVRAADVQSVPVTLPISQRIAAGEVGSALDSGTAARIFTGAPLPEGADAVVMQENTEAADGQVTVVQSVVAGENLRQQGEDIPRGATLYQAGHRLLPQDIGVLASVGATEVKVIRRLSVALLTTGDELVTPGTSLEPGQIYNSNHFSLAALLNNLCADVMEVGIVNDDFETTREELEKASAVADCIISTGGVSVGEEDHVKAAVETLGSLDLWKLAIKPGKPFASGKIGSTQFFGLPGNPVSAFVTFVLLVRPFLLTMSGCQNALPRWLPVACAEELASSGERQEYIRVSLVSGPDGKTMLKSLKQQSSGAGSSLSLADGLAIIPAHTSVARGDTLEFLPFSELIY